MPQEPHEDPAALLAELRERVESAAAEITQLTDELARRDGCIDELESALDTVLGLVEQPIMIVNDDHRIRALSRGAAQRFGRDAGVGKPLSAVVPEEVFAAVRAQRRVVPPDDGDAGGAHRPSGAGRATAAVPDTAGDTIAVVAPLPGEGAIVVLTNRDDGGRSPALEPGRGRSPARRTRRSLSPDEGKEQGRRERRSR